MHLQRHFAKWSVFVIVFAYLATAIATGPGVSIAAAQKRRAKSKGRRSRAKESPRKVNVNLIVDNADALPVTRKGEDLVNLPLTARPRGRSRLSSEFLDYLIADELMEQGMQSAAKRANADQFARRLYLDVLGRLPTPPEIENYRAVKSEAAKASLIDQLLDHEAFGRNLARYWRDVMLARVVQARNLLRPLHFEDWLAEQFNRNAGWDEIVTKILTARGLSIDHPEVFFVATHNGDPAELAGEAARVFLGLHVQCAECHDHPHDTWRRQQFHELAAFFSGIQVRNRPDRRTREHPQVRDVLQTKRKHIMPNLADPSERGMLVEPIFLTGQAIPQTASDGQRRRAVSKLITSVRNTYFARAFVNRVWAELLGYGFTNPVDDISSAAQVVYPRVFQNLSECFRRNGFDVKELYRVILNSKTYERRYREIEGSFGEDIMFATIHPTRLRSDQLFDCLESILGPPLGGPTLRRGRRRPEGLRQQFRQAFNFDPSANQEDLEGSVLQGLLLMNNPALHARISAGTKGSLLHRLLKSGKSDKQVVENLYVHVLARRPAAQEMKTCLEHLAAVDDRAAAFEDVLWCLLNSTEFLFNH